MRLTKSELAEIVDRENLVIRNLQITQGYFRISQAMRKLIGSKNASWCAFATHASKTAGQALRHELMPRTLKSLMIRRAGFDDTFFYLNDVLNKANAELDYSEGTLLGEAMRRVSLLISAGNVLVFDELAWPFVCLINAFSDDWTYDERKLNTFLQANFRKGPLAEDGQDYLIEAFTAYYRARFETNSKRKAEYVLQGNLLVGLHEQTRLQTYIEQALAVPFDVFVAGRGAGGQALSSMRQLVTRAVTRTMMSITLPNREMKLGQDVIAPTGVIKFSPDLLTIEEPRCRELVLSFDAGVDTLSGSGAGDWVSLKDRMSYVVDFFRSYQQYKRMFEPPFLDSQVAALDAGHLPAGKL